MAQLDKFKFDQSGSLVFDDEGRFSKVGARNCVDFNGFLEKARNKEMNSDEGLLFSKVGPFKDIKSYFLAMLNGREGKSVRTPFNRGSHNLLRLFID